MLSWKSLSFPLILINTRSRFKLAQGCNNDRFLGVEIFHYTEPGFKIHDYNIKLNQWEEKTEFKYEKIFANGIIINQQTGILYVPIVRGTELLHIDLQDYKIVKHVTLPQDMFDYDSQFCSPGFSRSTTVILCDNTHSLLYVLGQTGDLFLYHINKNI
eukprot:323737_1